MTTDINRLRQHQVVLGQARGLLKELKAKTISRGDFDSLMHDLEKPYPDLPVLFHARSNPSGDGHLVTEELERVRQQIADTTNGTKP